MRTLGPRTVEAWEARLAAEVSLSNPASVPVLLSGTEWIETWFGGGSGKELLTLGGREGGMTGVCIGHASHDMGLHLHTHTCPASLPCPGHRGSQAGAPCFHTCHAAGWPCPSPSCVRIVHLANTAGIAKERLLLG